MKTRLHNGTIIEISADGETLITLPDGRQVPGCPQGTRDQLNPHQITVAHQLGYSGDVFSMVRDHDPLHALLCNWLGLPDSFSLSGSDPILAQYEEAAVLAIQEFLRRAGGRLPEK